MVLFTTILLVVSLAACGNSKSKSSSNTKVTTQKQANSNSKSNKQKKTDSSQFSSSESATSSSNSEEKIDVHNLTEQQAERWIWYNFNHGKSDQPYTGGNIENNGNRNADGNNDTSATYFRLAIRGGGSMWYRITAEGTLQHSGSGYEWDTVATSYNVQ